MKEMKISYFYRQGLTGYEWGFLGYFSTMLWITSLRRHYEYGADMKTLELQKCAKHPHCNFAFINKIEVKI